MRPFHVHLQAELLLDTPVKNDSGVMVSHCDKRRSHVLVSYASLFRSIWAPSYGLLCYESIFYRVNPFGQQKLD